MLYFRKEKSLYTLENEIVSSLYHFTLPYPVFSGMRKPHCISTNAMQIVRNIHIERFSLGRGIGNWMESFKPQSIIKEFTPLFFIHFVIVCIFIIHLSSVLTGFVFNSIT